MRETVTETKPVAEPSLAATGETPEIADTANGNQRLQEVLPDIMALAQRVGGLPQLAELIDTLRHARG